MGDLIVLITGAGAPGAPGIIKSLRTADDRKIRIIGVDMDSESSGFAMVDKWYIGEKATSDAFIPRIMEICEKEDVDVVMPLVTNESMEFAKNKSGFAEIDVKVLVSSPGGLHSANNKYDLMRICEKIDVPTPHFRKTRSWDEFEKAVFDLGYPNVPVCFKPPISNGSRGFRIIDENIDCLDMLLNHKPTNVFTNLNGIAATLKDLGPCISGRWKHINKKYYSLHPNVVPFPELLVMEYLPGKEYSVDVLADTGTTTIVIPRSRDKVKGGISFVGVTENNEEIIEHSKKIVEQLRLHGNIGLQFKLDSDGVPKIIESNPRVQGTIVLCTAAGINMVYNAVKLAMGEQITDTQDDVKWGVKMIRYWDEVYMQNGSYFSI